MQVLWGIAAKLHIIYNRTLLITENGSPFKACYTLQTTMHNDIDTLLIILITNITTNSEGSV